MIDGDCTVLFRKNKLGVGEWRIWTVDNVLWIGHAQVVNGSLVTHQETVQKGLAGRSMSEQIASRVASRINKQRDRGYVDTFEDARDNPRTNMLDLPHPMLAKKITDMRGWPGKAIQQPKLDGFRCLATRNSEGEVICYTRGGKILDALVHVTERLEPNMPDDFILDGEIYQHGKPLQAVASLAKRRQIGTELLTYHVYDCIDEGGFLARYDTARTVVDRVNSERIVMVPNHHVSSEDEMWSLFVEHREAGYEGSMLRFLDTPYESGCRSKGLLKVKARLDEDFPVVDIDEDKNGNARLHCRMKHGKIFKTTAPGNFDQKKFVLAHKDQYIGRDVEVEFANYTDDGIPFHAVATRWKEVL